MSMYQIDQKIQSEGSSTKIFSLGITENVEMTNVSIETAANGNSYLKFAFLGPEGSMISNVEFAIDTAIEGWEKKMQSQAKRVKHIMTKFLDEDQINITANNFEEFCKQVIAKLGNSYIGKKLRTKTIYSYNRYISFPKYVPFLEDMNVEKSRLTITDFDKMEKDEADNPSALKSTAPNNGTATEPAESDLPF